MPASFQQVLSSALTPITLISGVGMLMLCMTNRYSHCTDRIRQLVRIRAKGLKTFRVEPDIDAEIRLIYRRAKYLRFSMLAVSLSAACSGLLVASNVFGTYFNFDAAFFAGFWLVLSVILVIAGTIGFACEIEVSLHALGLAVEHMPRGDALLKRLEKESAK